MQLYDIVFVLSYPIFSLSIFKVYHSAFGDAVYNRKIEVLSYTIYTLIAAWVFIVISIPAIVVPFNIACFFLLLFNYETRTRERILYAFGIYSFFTIIEIVISILSGLYVFNLLADNNYNSIVGLLLIRIITIILSFLFCRYRNSKKEDVPIPIIYYVALTLVLSGTLYLLLVSLENNNLNIIKVIVSACVVLIINCIVIVLYDTLHKTFLFATQKKELEQQTIAYENQAKLMRQSNETICSMRHDMKNHILAINDMYLNDRASEIASYSEEILLQLDNSLELSKSNNFAFDSIINMKLSELKRENVMIDLEVNVPQEINILSYDVTVILGNLLDNAITALKSTHPNKYLSLKIKCAKGKLMIFIDNTFNGSLHVENEALKTTKKDKDNNGIGIRNVEKSLEKYGGHMRVTYTENVFSVAIIISYKTK